MRFLESLSVIIIYAIIILSPIPYGSIEELWKFLLTSAIALTGILLIIKLILNKNIGVIFHKAFIVFYVIILALLFTALFSPRPYSALRSWIFFAGMGLVPFIIINTFNTREKLKKLLFLLLFSGLIFSIYGLIDVILSATTPGEHFRLTFTSTFYNHNHFAGFLECILPFAISSILFNREEKEGKSLKYILLSAILFATLLLTFSRGGIISFVIALLIVVMLYLNNFRIFVPTLLVSSIILYLTFSLKPILSKIFSFEQITLSGHSRMLLWKSGLMSILDKPFLGWGPGNFEIAYLKHRDSIDGIVNYAHNDFLQAFVELGIPIALVFISLIIWVFISGIREIKKRHNPFYYYLGTSATFALISIAIHEFVDFNLYIPANSLYFSTVFSIFILATFAERRGEGSEQLIEKSASLDFKKIIFPACISVIILFYSAGIFYNELIYKMAENKYRSGEIETVDRALEAIESSLFKSPKYYNLHCVILNTRAGIENSTELLEKALQKCILATHMDNFNSFYALDTAEIQKKLGRINEAIYFFKTASEIDPENAYFKSILIQELIDAGEVDEAKNLSIEFINKHPAKVSEILSILKNNRVLLTDFITYLSNKKDEINENVLNFLNINNLYEEYLELFLKVYPNKSNFSRQSFYNIAGNLLINDRKFDEAENILYSGIKLFPYESEGYLNLMNLLFFSKKYDKLLKLTEEAERMLNITEAYYYKALVFLEKGEFSMALKNAKLCLGRNVNNNKYRYLLYDIYMKMDMEYDALQALGDPTTYTSDDVHLMFLRASLFEKWNKYEDAIKEYNRILVFQPTNQTVIKKIIDLAEKEEQ